MTAWIAREKRAESEREERLRNSGGNGWKERNQREETERLVSG